MTVFDMTTTQTIETISCLDALLCDNRFFANGKNRPLDHLYATGASSRWSYENIYGIYLTNPDHAWMALWMAVTDRTRAKKRNLTYIRPDPARGDHIGKLAVYDPSSVSLDVFCDSGAYLYLVDPARFSAARHIDMRSVPTAEKEARIQDEGFVLCDWERRGEARRNYFPTTEEPMQIDVDSWQVALVNVGMIVPDIRVFIAPALVEKLKNTKVSLATSLSPEKYIVDRI